MASFDRMIRYLPVYDWGQYDGGPDPVGEEPYKTYATREEAIAALNGHAYGDVWEILV